MVLRNARTQAKFCQVLIVPELGTLSEPTAASSTQYKAEYYKYIDQSLRNYGSQLACTK